MTLYIYLCKLYSVILEMFLYYKAILYH